MVATFPILGQKSPNNWNDQLKAYIDTADAAVPSLDAIAETTTWKKMTPSERAKLASVANAATANASDAALRDRTTHTGTQTSTTISDFVEAAQDAVAAMLTSGTNVSLSYNDAGNTLQITATGVDAEAVRDTIGAAMVGINGVSVNVNDAADTITLSITNLTIAQTNGLQAALDAKVALPVAGVTVVEQFITTDPTIARPAVPAYVNLNWVCPAGTGGAAPTNMIAGDTWDLSS